MGVNSLPKTVTRQRRDCDLNPGPSAPESKILCFSVESDLLAQYETLYNSTVCNIQHKMDIEYRYEMQTGNGAAEEN